MSNLNIVPPASIQDILESLTGKAYSFVKNEIGGKNTLAKQSLKKTVYDNEVTIKSFDDSNIDFLSFDWCSIERDRNWWWQMQALPFMDWFSRSHLLFEDNEQESMFDYCISSLLQWNNQEKFSAESPLRWHDHATAYRLSHLVNWLVVVSSLKPLRSKLISLEPELGLSSILSQHVDWLSQEENYSKHTNHGFDQAMAIFSLGLLTGKKFWLDKIKLAEARLVDEVRFAFTEEGVHKENSPGYHVFMMRRLENLVRLEQLGETTVGAEARKIQEGAERFLEAITLPDGTLPMVGDTRGGEKGKLIEIPKGPVVYDFSKSGYVIVKGLYESKPYYLLFKNCHDSNYHRHDDDLSICLFYNDSMFLGDGGLGFHKEDDPKRKLLRSSSAHNVPLLFGKRAARKNDSLHSMPRIRVELNKVVGISWAHGYKIKRVIDFSRISEGCVDVIDKLESDESPELHQNFYTSFPIDRDEGFFVIKNQKNRSFCLVKNSHGMSQFGKEDNALISFFYGKFDKASCFGFKGDENKVISNIIFGFKGRGK